MRLHWRIGRFLTWEFATLYLRIRVVGAHHVPRRGGVILVSSHQSYLDPPLVAMIPPRESSFMARDSLFRNRRFAWLIRSLNAFPVKRDEADITAIKEALRRLKRGGSLVVFPEGTRTEDGRIGGLKPGFGAIARKARVPLVPVLVDGLFQAWPRDAKFPRPGSVIIEFGEPVFPADDANQTPESLIRTVRDRLVEMQRRLHRRSPERRLEWYSETDG